MSSHGHGSHSHNSDSNQNELALGSDTHVRVGKFPGTLKEVEVKGKSVVADILAVAELTSEGYELRLNGSPASIQDRVEPGDTVYLVKPIKGN